jgi:hypothetical protein
MPPRPTALAQQKAAVERLRMEKETAAAGGAAGTTMGSPSRAKAVIDPSAALNARSPGRDGLRPRKDRDQSPTKKVRTDQDLQAPPSGTESLSDSASTETHVSANTTSSSVQDTTPAFSMQLRPPSNSGISLEDIDDDAEDGDPADMEFTPPKAKTLKVINAVQRGRFIKPFSPSGTFCHSLRSNILL